MLVGGVNGVVLCDASVLVVQLNEKELNARCDIELCSGSLVGKIREMRFLCSCNVHIDTNPCNKDHSGIKNRHTRKNRMQLRAISIAFHSKQSIYGQRQTGALVYVL